MDFFICHARKRTTIYISLVPMFLLSFGSSVRKREALGWWIHSSIRIKQMNAVVYCSYDTHGRSPTCRVVNDQGKWFDIVPLNVHFHLGNFDIFPIISGLFLEKGTFPSVLIEYDWRSKTFQEKSISGSFSLPSCDISSDSMAVTHKKRQSHLYPQLTQTQPPMSFFFFPF